MRPPIWFVSLLNIVNCIDVMTSAPLSRASYARFGFPLLTSKKVSSAGMLFFLSREGNGGPFFKVVLECPAWWAGDSLLCTSKQVKTCWIWLLLDLATYLTHVWMQMWEKSDIFFCKKVELKNDAKVQIFQAGCHGRLKSTNDVNTGLEYIYIFVSSKGQDSVMTTPLGSYSTEG